MDAYFNSTNSASEGWSYTASILSSFDAAQYAENLGAIYGVSEGDFQSNSLCTPTDPTGLLGEGPTIGRGALVELQSTSPEDALKMYESVLAAPFAVAGAFAIGTVAAQYEIVKGVTVGGVVAAYEYGELGWNMLFNRKEGADRK